MSNKQTALQWFEEQSWDLHYQFRKGKISSDQFGSKYQQILTKALAIEKEQNIEFANKVLYNAECSFSGIAYLEKDINELYNEKYNKQ